MDLGRIVYTIFYYYYYHYITYSYLPSLLTIYLVFPVFLVFFLSLFLPLSIETTHTMKQPNFLNNSNNLQAHLKHLPKVISNELNKFPNDYSMLTKKVRLP